jgi:hypothetical protein
MNIAPVKKPALFAVATANQPTLAKRAYCVFAAQAQETNPCPVWVKHRDN